MQLYHEYDSTYIAPGRQKSLPLPNLVISLFFNRPTSTSDIPDDFFKFSNLDLFATGSSLAYFQRPIKLGNIVQNVPSYLYQGTFTNPNCDNTFWIIMTKYNIISESDLTKLYSVLISSGYLDPTTNTTTTDTIINSGSNGRGINSFFNSNNVYRNFVNTTRMLPEKSYFRYASSSYLNLSLVIVMILIALCF